MSDSNALVRLTTAVRLLSEARDLDDIMRIREMAQVAEQYAKAEKLGDEAVQYAQEIRVRAARRAGEVLREMTKHPGGNPNLSPPTTGWARLTDMGITRDQSSRWQRMAVVPAPEFEERVADGWGETAIARGGHVPRRSCEAVTPKTKTNGFTFKQSLTGLQAAAIQVQSLAEALEGELLGDWGRLYDVDEAQISFETIASSLPVLTARLKRALREWKERAA